MNPLSVIRSSVSRGGTPHSGLLFSALCNTAVAALVFAIACGNGDDEAKAPVEPLFPADYAQSYVEVRDCRVSSEHLIVPVKVFADPVAAPIYLDRDGPFPEGAILLKQEYAFDDRSCTGPIQQYTVMQREAAGSGADRLEWHWQEVDNARKVLTENEPRCYNCHRGCGNPPEGYLGTCTVDTSP